MKKKILLTGASGFVGGHFKNLYSEKFDIAPLNLRTTNPDDEVFKGVDCVVHCAALVHQMAGAPEEEYFKINFELTKNLANYAKKCGVKHFVFLSTAHVFGDSGSLVNHEASLSEHSNCSPSDAYGKSKLAAEKYLLSCESEDFTVSIIRPPMVYGKGAKGNIINLAKLIKLFPLLPFDFQLNKRSVVFIGNLCQFIALAIEKRASGVLLPQDPAPVSIATLTSDIAAALKVRIFLFRFPQFLMKILFKLAPKTSVRLYGSLAFDSSQSNAKLGFHALYTTKTGLQTMFSNSST